MAISKCKECGEEIGAYAKECPKCGAAIKKSSAFTLIVLLLTGLVLVLVLVGSNATQKSPEQRAEERRNGRHCLSSWDGTHKDVVKYVKQRLKDPGSFEHIETFIFPSNERGIHRLTMKYRAKNSFGGFVVGRAEAHVNSADCSAEVTKGE
ncbi:zinc ribbon domain-containing protein [Magnetofaba australis]|uniref:zinc ribbon domain-containing protein n=1 Tax=Magnetofaba australis TaxID=1472297 RepID=UPI000A19EF28|nr:zinc-ribbon domain-containing protein [Magnetofaba australis]